MVCSFHQFSLSFGIFFVFVLLNSVSQLLAWLLFLMSFPLCDKCSVSRKKFVYAVMSCFLLLCESGPIWFSVVSSVVASGTFFWSNR